jgi:hypothetical protein
MKASQLLDQITDSIANNENMITNCDLSQDVQLKAYLMGELDAYYRVAFGLSGDPLYIAKLEKMNNRS